MFLKHDNVGAERTSSGRLFQATGPATQNADCRVVRPSNHEQRNGEQKGWNSRSWDAQFVEITWCQCVCMWWLVRRSGYGVRHTNEVILYVEPG